MMGPKRMSLVKEPVGQNVEITKKKAPVSVSLNRSTSQKIKENTSTIKKSATSNSVNFSMQAGTKKTQNRQASPVKQIKKPSQSNITIAYTKTLPKTIGNSTRSRPNVSKTSVQTPTKTLSNYAAKEKNNEKDKNYDLVKSVSKNVGVKLKTESRLSVPLLHPVALIKDESKTFKEKVQSKSKKPLTATLTPRTPRTTNRKAVFEPKVIVNSSSKRVSPPTQRDVDSETVYLDGMHRIFQSSDVAFNEISNFDVIGNRNNYSSKKLNNELGSSSVSLNREIQTLNKLQNEFNEQMYNRDSEDMCVCNLEKEFIAEDREEKSDTFKPISIEDYKVSSEELHPDMENIKLESNNKSIAPICDTTLTSYIPSFYPQMLKPMMSEGDRDNEFNSETLIKIQSRELFASAKNENSDKKDSVESSFQSTDLQNQEHISREMKQSLSTTTMESIFDTKTFILEKPLEIPGLIENPYDMDSCENLEKKILVLKNQEKMESDNVKCVLEVNDLDNHSDNPPYGPINPQTITGKDITQKNFNQEIFIKPSMNSSIEVGKALSECKNSENEDLFDNLDPFEVLNLARVCNAEDNILEISNEFLFTFAPNKQSDKVSSNLYDDGDEFASESEDVLHTFDLGNSVWVDYKMPFNKSKPEDDSELWILDQETDDSSRGDVVNEETIVFLEPDEQDWIITERRLDDLRACLDECKEEAEHAAREINRFALRSSSQTANRKHSNSSPHNNSMNKSSKIINVSSKDELKESLPNHQLNYEKDVGLKHVENACLVEDDIDYFSVSSCDEHCDNEIDNKSTDMKQQKSYLSFGKSCVKKKKKNEKKVFLSFFNLFK